MRQIAVTELVLHPGGRIELTTNTGLTGWGEGERCDALLSARPDLVVGRSPFEMEAIFDEVTALGGVTPGGLDMALWDLAARSIGRPVRDLLGKVCRTATPVVNTVDDEQNLTNYRILSDYTTPLATVIRDYVQTRRVDMVIQDVGRCGLTGLKRLTYLCWLFRVRLTPASLGGDIATAAALEAAACIPPVTAALNPPPVFVLVPRQVGCP